jgi:hypothetical protein
VYMSRPRRWSGAESHCIAIGHAICIVVVAVPLDMTPDSARASAASGAMLKEARTVRESRMPKQKKVGIGIGLGTAPGLRARKRRHTAG